MGELHSTAQTGRSDCCPEISVGDEVVFRVRGVPVGPNGALSYVVKAIDHVHSSDKYYLRSEVGEGGNAASAMHLLSNHPGAADRT